MPLHSNCLLRRRLWLPVLLAGAIIASPAIQPTIANASELRYTAIVKAIQDSAPSIVNIHGRKTVRNETPAANPADAVRQVNGMGTGIVIDPRGYIITNYHVVEGVSNIQVTLSDSRDTVARLIANDPRTDLAIIKIDAAQPIPVIRFGTSCDLMTGESVVAIGNAYGYEHTVTRGIISALHRSVQVSDEQKYSDLIQTDASINPGNSGGPLLNIDGEVVGINVAVRVGAQGIGFAIPIDEALEIAAKLMSVERLDSNSHGIVGKTNFTAAERTFTVSSVRSDSPASKSGLKAGDVITQIDDRKIERALDVELALLGHRRDESVTIAVDRNRSKETVSLALAPLSRPSTIAKPALADRVWETLGMRLNLMNDGEFRQLNTRYRGGLQVTAVRPDSPAAEQGMRRGDVLVGMHAWETVSLENVAYILDREDLTKLDPVVFYILRGNDTLYGHLHIAARPATTLK